MRKRIGIIGDPVDHSLSPVMQQAALDALGIPVDYLLWPTKSGEIPSRIAAIRSGEWFGANVTVPHKEAFVEAVDELSDLARRAGAVNTLSMRDGKLHGDNTDIPGFLAPLRERGFPFEQSSTLILGAGGASRAVAIGLLDAGIESLTIANRTPARAEQLVDYLEDDRLEASDLNQAFGMFGAYDLVVNATSLGWHGEAITPPDLWQKAGQDAIAYDLTYRFTPFLKAASDAGRATIDGLPMLVHQGVVCFKIWTGQDAPVDVMMQAALEGRLAQGE